ncbi:C4-dicarboxylate ABC transporter [Endozoicomonas montiporae]|uniref:C4-dicarboxylate transporter n=2 Tax=Endozoicomonas montiporae TaxID=1027273 RepID=A0A081NBE2_9GAMM|nr:anaerobic C4-dicarboxylate transporter [Endozoicomonas montiporae]AMO56042.1 anaerobic C4-dicarboxylate transporter [Endozoicomonas montiporae CL-33]KEQ15765.1 C4-dicarboxylate ABC transporter [Endozoicomonas montiporae]
MFLVQLLVVLACILIGARIGGVGLGLMGGVGLAILSFVFGLQPTSPPIDVMLMIVAVVSAAACMQAAGGLDYLVQVAEKILRKNPKRITFMAPAVTYVFTMFAGTGHVAYSVLPVIAEVSRRTGVRPERPLSMAVIASQVGIVASPIAAATVAMLGFLSGFEGVTLATILGITIPSTVIGLGLAALVTNKLGKELKDDPEFQKRMQDPAFRAKMEEESGDLVKELKPGAKKSVAIFLLAAVSVVVMGAFPSLRPVFESGARMGMAHTIEIIMLCAGAAMVAFCGINVADVTRGDVFIAGMRAVIAIFGIAWLGDTFFGAHDAMLKSGIGEMVSMYPWAFAIALFVLSVMVNSQGATTGTLMPLGVALGLPAGALIAMFPAVNGYFFVPNYGPIIASIDFDSTGTTKIGKYVFNHSFMLPGLMSIIFSVIAGFVISGIVM